MGLVETCLTKVAGVWPSLVIQALRQKKDVSIADVVAKYHLEALHFEELPLDAKDERVYTRFFQDPNAIRLIDESLRVAEGFDDDNLDACYVGAADKIENMDLMGYLLFCGCICAMIVTRGTELRLLGGLTPEQVITKSQVIVTTRITDEVNKRLVTMGDFLFGTAKVIGFAAMAATAFYATRWFRS